MYPAFEIFCAPETIYSSFLDVYTFRRVIYLRLSFLQMYDEFCPLLLNQFKSRDFMKFEAFNAALDEFYSKIESQRSEQQQKAKESTAMQKLNKIRTDQVRVACTV